jgi:hypothetical protein
MAERFLDLLSDAAPAVVPLTYRLAVRVGRDEFAVRRMVESAYYGTKRYRTMPLEKPISKPIPRRAVPQLPRRDEPRGGDG